MNRRNFITGLAGIFAASQAPAIITTPGLLMPVRKIWTPDDRWEVGPVYLGGVWPPPDTAKTLWLRYSWENEDGTVDEYNGPLLDKPWHEHHLADNPSDNYVAGRLVISRTKI